MSSCNCDNRDDELIWSCFCFSLKRGKFDSVPTQLNITQNGLHLLATKSSQCYHIDQISCCTILANNDDQIVDIDGGCCRKKSTNILENKVAIRLIIYNNKSRKLRRKQLLLLIDRSPKLDENLEEANLLKQKLDPLIHKGHAINKSILVILNPKSGKGKTLKLFRETINPMLEDSNIKYQVLTTKYPKHAMEFIKNHNDLMATYSAIVTLSGDGLLFEVLNGFVECIERTKSKKIPIPLSIIPGGSGNGLACSINNIFWNGAKTSFSNQIFDCTMHTIKGQPTAMDIVRIETDTKVYYSFLSFGWGLMADIDIESERLRFLGEQRFTLWSLYRTMALRRYNGKLSYLHADDQSGDTINSLDYPISDSWTTIDGEFTMVYAAYQKYLNSTVKFAPESKLDDEIIYLLYIKGDVSSFQIMQFLLNLEEGSHTKLPFVHFVPVKAFRLSPAGQNDIITIDGEQISCNAVQATIIPKMASILLRPSKT